MYFYVYVYVRIIVYLLKLMNPAPHSLWYNDDDARALNY